MGKRWLSLIMAISLALTLAACGGEAGPSLHETTEVPENETSVTEENYTLSWQNTEPEGEKVWTQEVHSGIREDGTFNEGTLFIGDSLTYGLVVEYLQRYELIGGAKYMAVVGAPLGRFFSDTPLESSEGSCVCSPEFSGLAYYRAAARMGESATAIYLMLGTNYNYLTTTDAYIEVVDYLLENCPNATIHLQLIPYSTSEYVDYEQVNESIREAYTHYESQNIERVMVIDTFSAIGMAQGYDGIHLNAEGKDAWYMALQANAINNNIPE